MHPLHWAVSMSLPGLYAVCSRSESVDHMHGFNSSVAKKKNAACVLGAGALKSTTNTCRRR